MLEAEIARMDETLARDPERIMLRCARESPDADVPRIFGAMVATMEASLEASVRAGAKANERASIDA